MSTIDNVTVPNPPPAPCVPELFDMTGWIEWFNPHTGRRYVTSTVEFCNAIQPIWYEVFNDNFA